MRKLFFIPFFIGILIGSFSCNVNDLGNSTTFPATVAVVDFDMYMGTIMCTQWGNIAAPSLLLNDPGDCLFVKEFTVDYDNQPSSEYLTATNIVKENVNKYIFEQSTSFEIGDYTLPISKLGGATSEFFKGNFFISATSKDKAPTFRLIYVAEEQEKDNVKNLYVLAKPVSSSSDDVSTFAAFDLWNFVYYLGRDTTLYYTGSTDGYNYRYNKVNLNYLSDITDGKPIFKTIPDVITIYIPR